MTKEEKFLIKILTQWRKEIKQLRDCVSYNGYPEIKSNLAQAEMSLGHALTKISQ